MGPLFRHQLTMGTEGLRAQPNKPSAPIQGKRKLREVTYSNGKKNKFETLRNGGLSVIINDAFYETC